MTIKTLFAAAIICAAPTVSGASSVPVDNNGTTQITSASGNDFSFLLDGTTPANGFQHTFTLSGLNNAIVSLSSDVSGFGGVVAQWMSGTQQITPDANGILQLETELTQNAPSQTVTVTYQTPAPVPLPASILLLGAALMGLGLRSRHNA